MIEPPSTTGTSVPPERGSGLATVIGAAVLSAIFAAVATVTLVAVFVGPSPTVTAAPSTSLAAASPSPAGQAVHVAADDAVVAVAEAASPGVVTVTTSSGGFFGSQATGSGSGFVYEARGLILTSLHVVDGSSGLTVTLSTGRQLEGQVVATDEAHDLAVVRVTADGLTALQIGTSHGLQVGQLLIAIGSPLNEFTDSVTAGILSATGRSVTLDGRQGRTLSGLLQTDAAINEGNSGGPLLDSAGHVVGVSDAVATSAQGIGLAVPIDDAASVMAQGRQALGS